jgi:uncharacterized protein YbjQ (UPF0145 family)
MTAASDLDAAAIAEGALRRLADLKVSKSGPVYTSDLSVDEFLLVTEVGFRPVGLVTGSSVYRTGYQFGSWKESQELDVLSRAMASGRELAMSTMQLEAAKVGAAGVVGVRLRALRHEFGSELAEFVAIGTAIAAEPGPGGDRQRWRDNKGQPFTSNLSGQDFCALIRAGYAPVGMVVGSCVYHVAHRQLGQVIGSLGRNVEIEQFTQGLYEARDLAMSRIEAAARKLAAEGIVSVQLHQSSHAWGSHTTEFLAVGTAVRPLRRDHEIDCPTPVLDLNADRLRDGRRRLEQGRIATPSTPTTG